jgi:hypothetical protein
VRSSRPVQSSRVPAPPPPSLIDPPPPPINQRNSTLALITATALFPSLSRPLSYSPLSRSHSSIFAASGLPSPSPPHLSPPPSHPQLLLHRRPLPRWFLATPLLVKRRLLACVVDASQPGGQNRPSSSLPSNRARRPPPRGSLPLRRPQLLPNHRPSPLAALDALINISASSSLPSSYNLPSAVSDCTPRRPLAAPSLSRPRPPSPSIHRCKCCPSPLRIAARAATPLLPRLRARVPPRSRSPRPAWTILPRPPGPTLAPCPRRSREQQSRCPPPRPGRRTYLVPRPTSVRARRTARTWTWRRLTRVETGPRAASTLTSPARRRSRSASTVPTTLLAP